MEYVLLLILFTEHGFLRGKRLVQASPVGPGKAEDGEAANGETKGPPPASTLIDIIVETVSKCSDEADDGVQLQVRNFFARAILRISAYDLHFSPFTGDQGVTNDHNIASLCGA